MKFIIQPSPLFSGAYSLIAYCSPKEKLTFPCANLATAQDWRRQLTQPAPQAVDSPPANPEGQTASISRGPIGNFTVTIYNCDGSVDDQFDCHNLSTAKYLTRNFR